MVLQWHVEGGKFDMQNLNFDIKGLSWKSFAEEFGPTNESKSKEMVLV